MVLLEAGGGWLLLRQDGNPDSSLHCLPNTKERIQGAILGE
jgi:hypothetical protein